jgi:hypothetical protein
MGTFGTKAALLAAVVAFAAAFVGGAGASPRAAAGGPYADVEADLAAQPAGEPSAQPAADPTQQAAPAEPPPGDQPGQSENAPGHQGEPPGPPEGAGNGDKPGSDKGPGGAAPEGGSDSDPPGCNGTIHLSASGSSVQGTEPKYTRGETVYVHGTGFDASEAFTSYTVEDVNDHVMVGGGGGWSADASGAFVLTAISTSGLVDAHEYKITVYWPEMLPNGESKECRKSKNFFIVGSTEEAGGQTGGQPGGQTGGETGGQQPGAGETGTEETSEQPSAGTAPTAPAGGGAPGGETTTVTPTGGTAGVSKTQSSRGALAAAAQGQLPFTGFPAWVLVLAGAALAVGGFGLRRALASHSP